MTTNDETFELSTKGGGGEVAAKPN